MVCAAKLDVVISIFPRPRRMDCKCSCLGYRRADSVISSEREVVVSRPADSTDCSLGASEEQACFRTDSVADYDEVSR